MNSYIFKRILLSVIKTANPQAKNALLAQLRRSSHIHTQYTAHAKVVTGEVAGSSTSKEVARKNIHIRTIVGSYKTTQRAHRIKLVAISKITPTLLVQSILEPIESPASLDF